MGTLVSLCVLSLFAPQSPAAKAVRPPVLHPDVVLAAAADPVPLAEFGLGSGGFDTADPGFLRWSKDGCTTPGGARIECQSVGVKLTFPSGRELLVATDGGVHLRSGERAGPFPAGLELRLGDGSTVRITLSQSTRERLRDVQVTSGDRVLQPWRRGEATTWIERPSPWAGLRFCCCGDGGDLYRAIALGPLVVLDRTLVAADRADHAPGQRLVVLTAPLLQSLAGLPRQQQKPDPVLRHMVTAVAAIADRGDAIFPAGAALSRADQDTLRWLLRGGYELQLDLDGPMAPRLSLFAGDSPRPIVEWTLQGNPALFLGNPGDDAHEKRWHGNGVRLPRIAADLQARDVLFERGYALRVIARLRR
ncbi:MAG: hypothetical protein JNM25_07725 [Planctomycetes bacterium]|nr:hypothetical protein [Planctomycetota bacterium]